MLCWQYRSSGGAKSASVKICMRIVGTIILTIGVAWCIPATLSVIRLRQSDRHHMLLFGWLVFHGERTRASRRVRRQRPGPVQLDEPSTAVAVWCRIPAQKASPWLLRSRAA
jgi:hypothetical protein